VLSAACITPPHTHTHTHEITNIRRLEQIPTNITSLLTLIDGQCACIMVLPAPCGITDRWQNSLVTTPRLAAGWPHCHMTLETCYEGWLDVTRHMPLLNRCRHAAFAIFDIAAIYASHYCTLRHLRRPTLIYDLPLRRYAAVIGQLRRFARPHIRYDEETIGGDAARAPGHCVNRTFSRAAGCRCRIY